MKRVCVFCSASDGLNQDYIDAAKEMGQLLGKRGHHLVYGGSHKGLMGEMSKAFAEHSNNITEIIPKMWTDIIVENENAIITEDIHERLRKMHENSDAYIALPGGFGSLHEIMDTLVTKQLGIHDKPIVIININGLFDPILEQLKKLISEGLAEEHHYDHIKIANTPEEAIKYIEE